MTQQDTNNWIMYHEIHKLHRLGFSNARIARYLVMDPRTVSRYLKLTEGEYEQYLIQSSQRKKVLDPYEAFVRDKLSEYPETSAAQIHDWLKEHYRDDLPDVSPRTVYNFVMHIRDKHNIPCVFPTRTFFPIEELPYGHQAQVDFGQYNMRQKNGKRKKVYFFSMVLSRSRMKFTFFTDKPFTTEIVIQAHEQAFAFFRGIPKVIVYDLDKTIVVDENLGDIILTTGFKQYTKTRSFELHFCRKADPQSKGKVENVIQYIKKNFLYNRVYHDIETLNEESLRWLARTANYLPHNYTKKRPEQEFLTEQQYLTPYAPLTIKNEPQMKNYTVRKTNTIAYKSNFYTLPQGTWKGPGTEVLVQEEYEKLLIYDLEQNLICSHSICHEKGKTIRNTHHQRDTSKSLQEMTQKVINSFSRDQSAAGYIQQIQQQYPRYIRDHLQAMLKALEMADQEIADKTLDFCLKNDALHGREFEQILHVFIDEKTQNTVPAGQMKPLSENAQKNLDHTPQTSNIQDYENIINPKNVES